MILNLKVSPVLIVVLVMLHAGSLMVVALSPMNLLVRFALWAGILWSACRSVRRHGLRLGPSAIQAVDLDQDNNGQLKLADNADWHSFSILDQWVHPWIVIARLRLDGRRWPASLVIPADAVDSEAFRQLRVWLRLQQLAE